MFWEQLQKICNEKRIKPNTITKEIGLSTATATNWKNGVIPNGETLIKISDYLKCSTDYLLGRETKFNNINNNEYELLIDENKMLIDTLIKKLVLSQKPEH